MTNGKKPTSKSYQDSLEDAEGDIDDSIYESEEEREIMLDAFGEPVEFDEDEYGEDAMSSAAGRSNSVPNKKSETEQMDDVIVKLNEENKALKEKMMRIMADMENLRQRTKREKADTAKYAVSKFAGDMLTVSDNLHRAFEHVEADKLAENPDLKTLFEGVEMTERTLESMLERHGITCLAPEGERFDPNLHQAMFKIPNPDVDEGTVMQVIQAGYVIGDRLLRSAMVGVSTGGPKPEKVVLKEVPTEIEADEPVVDAQDAEQESPKNNPEEA